MTRAGLLVMLTAGCVAAGVAAAPQALAGQIVWQKGGSSGGIWVMDDNGQNQRPLISLSDAPGMSYVGSPHVHPLGGQTLAFTGSTTANSVTFGSRTYSGNNATGVYLWQAGAVTRMSGPPSSCTTGNTGCTTFHRDPEMAADGSYVFQSGIIVGDANSADFSYQLRRGTASGDSSEFPTQCSNENSSVFVGPEAPSPNPANPSELAYVGCDPGIDGSDYGVWVKTDTGSPALIADSAEPLRDPSWKLDGSGVLMVAGDSGIYAVSRDGSNATLLFAGAGADTPRDMGDRILFQSGFELYTIPASCNSCTLANATRLTTGGDSDDPSWTSAASFPAPASPTPGPGPGGQTGGGGTTDTLAPSLRATFSRRLRLRSVCRSGLPIGVNLGEAATVKVSVTVDGRTARRYRLVTGRRASSLLVGRTTRSLPAGHGSVRVKIAKKHARKLRRARTLNLKVTVTATDAAGNATTTRRTLKLKR